MWKEICGQGMMLGLNLLGALIPRDSFQLLLGHTLYDLTHPQISRTQTWIMPVLIGFCSEGTGFQDKDGSSHFSLWFSLCF